MYVLFVLALASFLGFLACAPRAATAPPAAPSVPVIASSPSSITAPVVSEEEASLRKLIEAAKKEGTVTIYSYTFLGDIGIAIQRAFKERYGINIAIITGSSAASVERLRTEARMGQRSGDFMEGGVAHLTNLKNFGLTVPIKDLPVLQEKGVWKIDPSFLDPEGHILAAYPYYMQPIANSSVLKQADEPKSWFDLLDPKWKGKLVFPDPSVSSGVYLGLQPLVRAGLLNEDYLKKLGAQDIIWARSAPHAVEMLLRGDATLAPGTLASLYSEAVKSGAPIKALDFREGITGAAIVQVVIKNSPNPNGAKLFANWWLSKEGQSVFVQAAGGTTIRNDVRQGLPPALNVEPTKIVFSTGEDASIQGKMFQDRIWEPILKKGK